MTDDKRCRKRWWQVTLLLCVFLGSSHVAQAKPIKDLLEGKRSTSTIQAIPTYNFVKPLSWPLSMKETLRYTTPLTAWKSETTQSPQWSLQPHKNYNKLAQAPAPKRPSTTWYKPTGYDPIHHQKVAMGVLLAWSALSITAGILMIALQPTDPWVGAGIQNIAWGGIDAIIGVVSLALMKPHLKTLKAYEAERLKFRTVLLINTALDVVYILVGLGMVIWGSTTVQGHGYGVLTQGGFLFLFDGINALLTLQR